MVDPSTASRFDRARRGNDDARPAGGRLEDGAALTRAPAIEAARDPTPPAASDTGNLRSVLVDLLATIDPAGAGGQADRLIATFGSLAAIGAATPMRLAALVGGPAAGLLAAHHAALLFGLREPAVRGPIVATRYELIDYLHHRMAHDVVEGLRVFFLNRRRELIAEELVARGGPDGIAAEPRQLLARALEWGATGLILVHNHPSGDPTPSLADRRFTRALAAAGDHLGIAVHDHLVVARDGVQHIVGDGD